MIELTHPQACGLLEAGTDGLLVESQQSTLQAHLKDCVECRAYASQLNLLETRLRQEMNIQAARIQPDTPTSSSQLIRRQILQRKTRLAFGTISVVAVVVLLVFVVINRLVPGGAWNQPTINPAGVSMPATAAPPQVTAPPTHITLKGITMYVTGSHQEGSFYQVDVCYSLPEGLNWRLTGSAEDATLTVGNQQIGITEEATLEMHFDKNGNPVEHCEYLMFPVRVKAGDNLTLTIQKVFLPEKDSEFLVCADLQKKLDDANSGIVIECATEPHVSGFRAVQKPTNMTDQQAWQIAFDLLTETRRGPWVFKVESNPGNETPIPTTIPPPTRMQTDLPSLPPGRP